MYNESESFAVKMKCFFSALAFLLLEDVVEGLETLTEDVHVPDEFLVYFEPSRCHFSTQALESARENTYWTSTHKCHCRGIQLCFLAIPHKHASKLVEVNSRT